ncbi:MAG TPA: OmpA family protein [Spirochaetota bacterium]|nr:OmpA family protein [Spirochaetota bacterium]HPJ35838.1 OmpA family protein [Spirochaetota bacterium]
MKKAFYLILVSILATFLLASCESQQPKTDTPTVKADGGGDAAVSMINNQVGDFSIDGFPGGSSKLKASEDLENMKRIVELVKPIVEQVPDGYVMQITGHAADYPTKALQRSVSKGRAYKVYSELKKAGVPAAKMTYKGVGISEPLSGYDGKDAKQRRVSFRAVKK